MILLRPLVKYRVWWDTELSRRWPANYTLGRIWAKHLAPVGHAASDNDRDHIKW